MSDAHRCERVVQTLNVLLETSRSCVSRLKLKNSGKVGRLIAVAMVKVGVPKDCEGAEVNGGFDSSDDIKTHSISDVCLINSAPQTQRFSSATIAIPSSSPFVRSSFWY